MNARSFGFAAILFTVCASCASENLGPFMQIHIFPEVEKFITSLEKQTVAKVLRTIDLLEKFSHNLGIPHSKKVAKHLFELRVRGQQEVRIFYCFYHDGLYLLHGFIKKSPQRNFPRHTRNMRP